MLYEEAESSTSTRRGEAPSKSPAPVVVPLWTSEKEPPPYGAQHYQDALWKGGNEALPPCWHQFKVSDRTYYQDDTLIMVSLNRPLPGVQLDYPGNLVPGCEWHISPLGRSYFVNHNTRITSWKKPRPARLAGSLTPECIIEGHSECIWSLACLKASCNVMSASWDGSIRQWKRDGEPVGKPLNSHGRAKGSMAVSPDETMVICGSVDGRIRLWNIKEGSMIGDPWEGHTAGVKCLDWSPNALEIASGSQDGTIRRWNPNTGRQIAPPIKTSHGWVNAVKYSPQGDKFISGGEGAICVWSRDGKRLTEIKGHDDAVTSLYWSKDGAHIFSGSGDDTIRKWRAIDGKELVVLRGHTHIVTSLCLTPNESYIVSASCDFSIRIWDLKTNQAVGDPLLHDDEVWAVAMSPDGKYVASAGLDKQIYVWSLEVALDRHGRDQGANDAKPKGRPTQPRVVRQPIQVNKIGLARYGNDFFSNESDCAPRRAVPPPSPSSFTRWRRFLSSIHFGTQPANASSSFRSQLDTHEEIEFSQYPGRPHVVEVAAVRDREVIFTAPPPPQNTQQQTQPHGQGSSTTPPAPGTNPTTPPRHPHSLPVRLLAHLVLFLCCASPQHASGNVQPMQQQGQPQGQAHAHASSQTQPVPLSTSTIPTPVITHAASPVAENV